MSRSYIYLATFVFCSFLMIAQAGTWLSFNQKAHNDLIPYIISDKDLANVIQMCKEEINTGKPILRHERNFAEMCATLSDLISGR
ncbi:Ribosomal RNA small subunit methyltransferase [Dirofilaria immitis]